MRRTGFLLLTVLLAGACRKAPPEPSPDYEQARALHVQLLGRYADDAYARPEMAEVVSLLERVPADSADADAAKDLAGRIRDEQGKIAEREAAQRKRLAAAGPGAWQEASPGAATGAVPGSGAFPAGMALEDFRGAYGDCFVHAADLAVEGLGDGGAQPGETWKLKDDVYCRDRHRDHVDRVAVFAGGKLVAERPASDVTVRQVKETVSHRVEVETVELPDGGVGARIDGGIYPVVDGGVKLP